jgi:hypothetical protein
MLRASRGFAPFGLLATLAGCLRTPCPQLQAETRGDAFAIVESITNAAWALDTVDAAEYPNTAGPSGLVFGVSSTAPFRRFFEGPHWCGGGGFRIFEHRADELLPRRVSSTVVPLMGSDCQNPRGMDAMVEDVLDHPFHVELRGDELMLQGPRHRLVYRSDYAAPVASEPLIGTWRFEAGPELFTRLHLRIRLSEDRKFRARWDCDSCGAEGFYALRCDGQGLMISVLHAWGRVPIPIRISVMNDAREVAVDGDRMTIETPDDIFVFRRVERAHPLEPDDADW